MRDQLSATLADAEDSATGEAVIAFASQAGFDISLEDLAWLSDALSGDALSDAALDEVSGGFLGAAVAGQFAMASGLKKVGDKLPPVLNPFKKDFWNPYN